MIAANEAVARLLDGRGVPTLFRVHERPDPSAVEQLVERLAVLGVPTPPLPDPLSPSQAAELIGPISRAVDAARAQAGPRPPRAHDARAALAQAGALRPAQPRPHRPALAAPTATSPRRSAATPT